nr:MAG TPA: hypothetical protein [Bacteriophage sp.]
MFIRSLFFLYVLSPSKRSSICLSVNPFFSKSSIFALRISSNNFIVPSSFSLNCVLLLRSSH